MDQRGGEKKKVVQITLKHLLVPNGYIPGMSLIYSSLHRCTFVHTGLMFALCNVVCFVLEGVFKGHHAPGSGSETKPAEKSRCNQRLHVDYVSVFTYVFVCRCLYILSFVLDAFFFPVFPRGQKIK